MEGGLNGRRDGSRGDIVWGASHFGDDREREWAASFDTTGRPVYYWCRNARRKGEGSPKFTTKAHEVTCRDCREYNKGATKRAWTDRAKTCRTETDRSYYENWRSDEELTIQCWWICCRHRVQASPFASPSDERQFVLKMRSKLLLRAVRVSMVTLMVDEPDEKFDRPILPDLLARIEKLDPEDQSHLKSVIAEARRVDELVTKARAGFHRLHELAHMAALAVRHPKRRHARGKATPTLTKVVGDLAKLAKVASTGTVQQ